MLWATGGQSGSRHADFGADFCGKIWEAWPNLSQEPKSEGNVTQTNAVLPFHVHTIDPKKDIKLCYGHLEVNLAQGMQILVLISVVNSGSMAKSEPRTKI